LYNEQFFKYVQLLHDKHEQKSEFNLFSVLRSDSDEVRLHSRFLGEILNPLGSHNHGDKFLRLFLKQLKIEMGEPAQAKVRIEYRNIDILICCGNQAIIIENKIYASDQDKQLTRYYEIMKSEGYDNIDLIYLTLDGRSPSDQSIDGLETDFISSDKYRCCSYKDDIHDWLTSCLALAIREPALRESFLQYINLIDKLTNRIQSDEYMDNLKNLLKSDNNLVNFLDLQQAFEETKAEAQLDMWDKINAALSPVLGEPNANSITKCEDKEAFIRSYIQGKKGYRYHGLFYPVDGQDILLYVEIDHRLYFGLCCNEDGNTQRHEVYLEICRKVGDYLFDDEAWSRWEHAKPLLNFRNPTKQTLEYLSSETKRQQFADSIAKRVLELADAVKHANK